MTSSSTIFSVESSSYPPGNVFKLEFPTSGVYNITFPAMQKEKLYMVLTSKQSSQGEIIIFKNYDGWNVRDITNRLETPAYIRRIGQTTIKYIN